MALDIFYLCQVRVVRRMPICFSDLDQMKEKVFLVFMAYSRHGDSCQFVVCSMFIIYILIKPCLHFHCMNNSICSIPKPIASLYSDLGKFIASQILDVTNIEVILNSNRLIYSKAEQHLNKLIKTTHAFSILKYGDQ